jgi:predicted nucleic acid-binding protein
MKDRIFLDTNILLYHYSATEPEKKLKVFSIADNCNVHILLQVINEFVNVSIKKFKVPVESIELSLAELYNNYVVYENSVETINKALSICKKYNYSYYDAQIIAAALLSNCKILYTEDLQHQQIIENSLQIINPFK